MIVTIVITWLHLTKSWKDTRDISTPRIQSMILIFVIIRGTVRVCFDIRNFQFSNIFLAKPPSEYLNFDFFSEYHRPVYEEVRFPGSQLGKQLSRSAIVPGVQSMMSQQQYNTSNHNHRPGALTKNTKTQEIKVHCIMGLNNTIMGPESPKTGPTREIQLNTNGHYMNESNTLAGNVTIKEL